VVNKVFNLVSNESEGLLSEAIWFGQIGYTNIIAHLLGAFTGLIGVMMAGDFS